MACVVSTRQPVDLAGRRWRLHPRVALRPEPFGALAYHYGNRRLNFLRSHDLVEVVNTLADYDNADRLPSRHAVSMSDAGRRLTEHWPPWPLRTS